MSTAVVTGASKGLGKALSEGLARRGWSLIVDGREPALLEQAHDRLWKLIPPCSHVLAILGDVADPEHRRALAGAAHALGGLDLLVCSDAAVEGYPGWGGYGAAKAAQDQIAKVLAVEEPELRVWAVDPGDMRTDMHQAAFPGEDISDRPLPEVVVPRLIELFESRQPSGRIRAADLAERVK